jgi:hypothetical protein
MSQVPWPSIAPSEDAPEAQEKKSVALSYFDEAFAEAQHDGLDRDTIAHAALFSAWSDLIGRFGEEAVAKYAEGLPDRIRQGCYSPVRRH